MPLFRYACARCEARFELYVGRSDEPRCPQCASTELKKQFTSYAVGKGGGKGGGSAPQVGPCGQVCGQPGGCQALA